MELLCILGLIILFSLILGKISKAFDNELEEIQRCENEKEDSKIVNKEENQINDIKNKKNEETELKIENHFLLMDTFQKNRDMFLYIIDSIDKGEKHNLCEIFWDYIRNISEKATILFKKNDEQIEKHIWNCIFDILYAKYQSVILVSQMYDIHVQRYSRKEINEKFSKDIFSFKEKLVFNSNTRYALFNASLNMTYDKLLWAYPKVMLKLKHVGIGDEAINELKEALNSTYTDISLLYRNENLLKDVNREDLLRLKAICENILAKQARGIPKKEIIIQDKFLYEDTTLRNKYIYENICSEINNKKEKNLFKIYKKHALNMLNKYEIQKKSVIKLVNDFNQNTYFRSFFDLAFEILYLEYTFLVLTFNINSKLRFLNYNVDEVLQKSVDLAKGTLDNTLTIDEKKEINLNTLFSLNYNCLLQTYVLLGIPVPITNNVFEIIDPLVENVYNNLHLLEMFSEDMSEEQINRINNIYKNKY